MTTIRWVAPFSLLAAAMLVLSCTPKRLREVAQKDDKRTEAQLRADRHMDAADASFDKGELQEAQKEYLAALGEDPKLFKAHLGLASIYELQGDSLATQVEFILHTEAAPNSKYFLERMFPYHFAKFSRNPGLKQDATGGKSCQPLEILSEAIVAYRLGNLDQAVKKIEEAHEGLPGSGLPDYFIGMVRLKQGDIEGAAHSFENSVGENGYFARRLLADRQEQSVPQLLARLRQVLERQLLGHPADTESSLVLGAIALRQDQPRVALKVVREALAWTNRRWDILFLKALAHERSGEAILRDQALNDLKAISPDLSVAFTMTDSSLFHGILADNATDFAAEKLAPVLDEPSRSYFLWRLKQEVEPASAEPLRVAFFKVMEAAFPEGEFDSSPNTAEPERQPAGMKEFMGLVQERMEKAMAGFVRCDLTHRKARANPSGRVDLRVELARDGTVNLVSVEENTTLDLFLGYCAAAKVLSMRFPKPLRVAETFKVPIFFGPEVDDLTKPKKGEPQP